MRRLFVLAATLCAASASGQTPEQAEPALTVLRSATPLVLDGKLDELAWTQAEQLKLVGFRPTAGAPPTEDGAVQLAYDDENLFIAARFSGSTAADNRSSSLTRDRFSGDNSFTVLLDTFGDRETGMMFATNPVGVRVDAAVASDGQSTNLSWNTVWDVATTREGNGWTVEMRLPFTSLRFVTIDDRVEMGLIITRFIAKTYETVSFPELSPRYANAAQRPSLARRIVLEGVRSRTPVYITPYSMGGATRTEQLNQATSRYGVSKNEPLEFGVDVKVAPSPSMALDFTVNTDFAQVEADNQQVNLSRYSLFFPEQRQFFQERAGLFQFNTGSSDRLFHSRRIGLADDGTPLSIYAGARAVGRVAGWDVGLLDMQAESADREGAGENFGVVRVRRPVWTPGSYVGGILTSRLGGANGYNVAYGLDTRLRVFDNDYLNVQVAQTFDEDAGSGLRSAQFRTTWDRRSEQGLVYYVDTRWIGPDHRPELGFFDFTDRTVYHVNLRYGWYPGNRTFLRNIQPSLNTRTVYRNHDGMPMESRFITQFLNWEAKNGFSGNFAISESREDLPNGLVFAQGVSVPGGVHKFVRPSLFIGSSGGKPFRLGLGASVGDFYDGEQTTVSISPTWNMSQHFEIGGSYNVNRVRFDSRNQKLDADIASVRIQAALNPRISATAFVQYNRSTEALLPNVRVRWHFSEGRDLYLVYNDFLNANRERLLPGGQLLPFSQNRALLLKYTHTFVR